MEITEKTRQLVENVDYSLLMTMTRNSGQVKESRNQQIAEEETSYYLENVLEKGRFDVGIAIYQLGSEGTRLSMANNGFEHLACIRNNNRGNWIELIIREMHAHSRIDGADMRGRLSSLKYEDQGQALTEVAIREGEGSDSFECMSVYENAAGECEGDGSDYSYLQCGEGTYAGDTALLMFWM